MVARDRVQSSTGPLSLLGTSYNVWNPNNITSYYGKSEPYFNRCIDSTHKGPPYKTGGHLVIRKGSLTHTLSDLYNFSKGFSVVNTRFQTRFHGTGQSYAPEWEYLEDITYEGTKGWNRFKPLKSGSAVGQSIGESIERLPVVPLKQLFAARTALSYLKAIGSEYLNVEFGWKPLVNDIKSIIKTANDLDRILRQAKKDNDKWIRRRGVIDNEGFTSVVETTGTYLHPLPPSAFLVNPAAGLDYRQVANVSESRSWFSAKFKYHIRDIPELKFDPVLVSHLFGVLPTPALLWELMPWSWLIDWFFDMGAVLANMTETTVFDLTASYAYAMKHMSDTEYCIESKVLWTPMGNRTYTAYSEKRTEVKIRQRASPFGFGFVPGDLDGRQKLILAALGVSRSW